MVSEMKIKFFGTAAAEGFPALFCSCATCEKARSEGGRSLRSRSQSLINDDLLIDFSADTYHHVLEHGLDLRKVKTLLVTHGHDDHIYPFDLVYRTSPVYSQFPNGGKDKKPLDIYITRNSAKLLRQCFKAENIMIKDPKAVKVHYVSKFKPFETAGYTVTALKADHTKNLDPVFYMVSKDGKNILYCHDTGYFPEKTWDYLRNSKIKFDLVSLDCTSAILDKSYSYHMGLKACRDVRERLVKNGNADKNTLFCLNHFSHNCGYTYYGLCEIAEKDGFIAAFDGLEIEI